MLIYSNESFRDMLNTRQKCLLYFMKNGKKCSRLKLAKIFFLMDREERLPGKFKFYRFVPYKFGPYSFELFHDIETLENGEMLTTDDKTVSFDNGDVELAQNISRVLDYYLNEPFILDEKELLNYVYDKYPEFTIFSEIEKKLQYSRDKTGVYSIGYEGLSIDEFILKLVDEKVQVLVDVRHNPWSMKFGYKKQNLQSFCKVMGIEYVNVPELGIPGNFRKELDTKDDYESLFKRYRRYLANKDEELEKLKVLANEKRIALMCFEKDPAFCHRTIIAKKLAKMGAEVVA